MAEVEAHRRLGRSELDVFPLALGGDVFGWTADPTTSEAVLDAYVEAGGNFIDTADVYNAWAPGHTGGESESIIGDWMSRRRNRNDVVLASKVGKHPELLGLHPTTIARAVEASLRRLHTDRIDLYYCHSEDPAVPLEDTLAALTSLVEQGKVRYIGVSNFSDDTFDRTVRLLTRPGAPPVVAAQPHYNLLERGFEQRQRDAALAAGVGVVPYSALAGGFLTGKYRAGQAVDTRRGDGRTPYATPSGLAVLDLVKDVARRNHTTPAAVAIGWLKAQPGVAAPITSARTVDQLASVITGTTLELSDDDLRRLDQISAPA